MKYSITFICFFLLFIWVAGCDSEIGNINLNSNLKKEFVVEVPQGANEFGYASTIDASQDSDLKQNINSIASYKIESIKFSIKDYIGPDTANLTGTITVGDEINSFSADIHSLNIKLFSEDEYTIALDEEQMAQLEEILLNTHQLGLAFSGTVSESPLSFRLQVVTATKVTINAI